MVSGAGHLCEAPHEGCGLPEARLLHPRQSDLGWIYIPAVKDALRSVHRQVYHCPVSAQFDEPAAVDRPQKTGAAGIVEGPLGRTTEQSHRVQLSLCDFCKSLTQIVSIHDRHQLGCGIEAKKEWLDSLDDL